MKCVRVKQKPSVCMFYTEQQAEQSEICRKKGWNKQNQIS